MADLVTNLLGRQARAQSSRDDRDIEGEIVAVYGAHGYQLRFVIVDSLTGKVESFDSVCVLPREFQGPIR